MAEESDSQVRALAPRYYVLQGSQTESAARITRYPDLRPPFDNWFSGQPWRIDGPANALFEIDEQDEGSLDPYIDVMFPLMSEDLLRAIRGAGVDNIEAYPAVIVETRTRARHTNYMLVNVVGVVKAADLAASDLETPGSDDPTLVDVCFNSLSLAERGIPDLPLFRLAESVYTLLVHKNVREHLLAAGLTQLTFTPPAEYAG